MNLINKKNKLNLVNEENIYKEITESHAEILSVIGVIEHLREPFKLFDAFRKSKIKYIFLLSTNVFIICTDRECL